MSSRFAVKSNYPPPIRQQSNLATTHCNHRLNGYTHSFFEKDSVATLTIVGHLRVFVHLAAYSMTSKFTHDTITITFTVLLNRITNITKVISSHRLFNTFIKCLFGDTK